MRTSVARPQRIIAIVDDDPRMQVSLSDLLGARGFETSVFSSAEDWLDRGASVRPDCMLVDVWLGGISGIELQRRLKDAGTRLPIIFVTAIEDEATRCAAMAAGCVAYLRKPFAARLLIDAIDNAMGGRTRSS